MLCAVVEGDIVVEGDVVDEPCFSCLLSGRTGKIRPNKVRRGETVIINHFILSIST
jgi:hypothetical protein